MHPRRGDRGVSQNCRSVQRDCSETQSRATVVAAGCESMVHSRVCRTCCINECRLPQKYKVRDFRRSGRIVNERQSPHWRLAFCIAPQECFARGGEEIESSHENSAAKCRSSTRI